MIDFWKVNRSFLENTFAGESKGNTRRVTMPIHVNLNNFVEALLMSASMSRGSAKIAIDGDVSRDSSSPTIFNWPNSYIIKYISMMQKCFLFKSPNR